MARYEVHDPGNGITSMPAKAIETAVVRRITPIRGVRRVRATVTGMAARVAVVPEQGQSGDDLLDRIKTALGHDFWIDLGMADMTYSVTLKPSRLFRS